MLLFLVTFARAVPVADKKRSLQLHSEDEEQDDEPMEKEDEPRVVELTMTTEELEKRGVFGM